MSRRMETGFVVAIAALTILTSATVIHDGNNQQPDRVGQWLAKETSRLRDWTGHKTVPTGSNLTGQLTMPHSGPAITGLESETQMQTSGTDNRPATGAVSSSTMLPTGFTAADFTELQSIVTKLVRQFQPGDWTTIENALSSSDTQQASTQIASILHQYLSPTDQAWLGQHFRGTTAFSSEDVVLLRQAIEELSAEMTTGEQNLLRQQLVQLGVSTGNLF